MTRIWLGLMLAFLGGVALGGCGQEVPYLLRTTASTAIIVSGGYRAINSADKTRQGKIMARARAGDPDGAEAELKAYLPKLEKALQALDVTSVAVETAYALVPTADQALDKAKRAKLTEWAATLVRLGVEVVAALDDIGVKVPIFGGAP